MKKEFFKEVKKKKEKDKFDVEDLLVLAGGVAILGAGLSLLD